MRPHGGLVIVAMGGSCCGLELFGVAAAEVWLPERAVGDVPWPLPRRPRRDARIRAISARRAAPVGGGGTGTPPALILHDPGTRMSGGAGYSAL